MSEPQSASKVDDQIVVAGIVARPKLPKQQRARSQLSCKPCRQGKLKCNRVHPCDQCTKRSRDQSCLYAAPSSKRATVTRHTVRERVNQLEQLVVDLMSARKVDETDTTSVTGRMVSMPDLDDRLTPPKENSPVKDEGTNTPVEIELGRMVIGRKSTNYFGETHWTAILGGISDLRRELSEDADESGDDDAVEGPSHDDDSSMASDTTTRMNTLLRSPLRMSKSDLIAALPSRQTVDRLLYQWFNSPDPLKCGVHPATFQTEYQRFWLDPMRTPVMWLALLFTIMSTSAQLPFYRHACQTSSEAQQYLDEATRYHELAASAAVLADYTRPQKYVVECLLLYSSCLRSMNAFADLWQLLGIVIRLALRMGYHRDGDHFPNISVFEKEMRRRSWHGVYMLDVLVSFHMGLPNMIQTVASDTLRPSNLQDVDLHVSMVSLPSPRPVQEFTPPSYIISKVDICHVFAAATDLSDSAVPPSLERAVQLIAKLDTAFASVPDMLRVRPIHQYIFESAEIIMWSYNLELLFLKTRIVVYRPFIGRRDETHAHDIARKECLEAAMRTLRHHEDIYHASQSGGQLEMARMFMEQISAHDFLLASTILCLELSHLCNQLAAPNNTETLSAHLAQKQEIVDLLRVTHVIWTKDLKARELGAPVAARAQVASDLKRAVRALRVMLLKADAIKSPSRSPTTQADMMWSTSSQGQGWSPTGNSSTAVFSDPSSPEMQLDLGMTDASALNVFDFDNGLHSADIDWRMWDQSVNTGLDGTMDKHLTFDWIDNGPSTL